MSGVVWFTIVAGPNGSGKTTLVEGAPALLESVGLPLVLNPDTRARELRELEGLESTVADERAVREIGERVKDCIRDRRSCMVETVLSTNKYREDVLEAKRQGSKVALVYVAVSSADLAVERVGMRLQPAATACLRRRFACAINGRWRIFPGSWRMPTGRSFTAMTDLGLPEGLRS